MTYGILYEETFSRSPEVWVEAKERPLAPGYERCHFIGHALWNPGLTKEQLMGYAKNLEISIEQQTGYRAFVVDIRIKQFPPFMTDVDFIIDVPTTKTLGFKIRKYSPIAPLVLVAIIAVCAVALAFIAWLFWTTYVEKIKLYYCDQETPPTVYEGWLQYVAHLKEKHPTKYQAIQESKSTNWWEAITEAAKWIAGALIVVTVGGIITSVVRGRK